MSEKTYLWNIDFHYFCITDVQLFICVTTWTGMTLLFIILLYTILNKHCFGTLLVIFELLPLKYRCSMDHFWVSYCRWSRIPAIPNSPWGESEVLRFEICLRITFWSITIRYLEPPLSPTPLGFEIARFYGSLTCLLNFGGSYMTFFSRGLMVRIAPLTGLKIKSRVRIRCPLARPSKLLFFSWYNRFSPHDIYRIKRSFVYKKDD